VPSIVIGIFVFSLLILNTGGRHSGFAGSVALAVIELPLIARAATEVLALVPATLREASLALGVSRWRTVVSVVIPTAMSGILTGTMLAIARAAGETAPLLVTSSILTSQSTQLDPTKALNSLPVTILNYSEAPDPALHSQAWAAAFLLLCFVLLTNIAARASLARSRRKLEGGRARRRRPVHHLFTGR
jgi:phosphate transport system permease protein